jgi:hypothetical protein
VKVRCHKLRHYLNILTDKLLPPMLKELQHSHWSVPSFLSIKNRVTIRGLDLLVLRNVGFSKKQTLFLVWVGELRLIHAMVVSCKQCMALEMS